MADLAQWLPRSAWDGVARAGRFGTDGIEGVTAAQLDGFGLASVIASPGDVDALSQHVAQRTGLALPTTPRIVQGDGRDAIWAGPGQWLLRTASRDAMPALISELAAHAAVTDQSEARAALRLSGPHLRNVLAKGVMIDLHPAAFAVGDVASTSIAHIGVQLWRLPDAEGEPVFEMMVARSYAGSFWSWLSASAAAFGCSVVDERG